MYIKIDRTFKKETNMRFLHSIYIFSSILILAAMSCTSIEEGVAPDGLTEAHDKGMGNIYIKQDPLSEEDKDSIERLKLQYEKIEQQGPHAIIDINQR